MPTKNVAIRHVWELGTTGLAAELTASLWHYADSSTRTTASETVTITEIGATGAYDITYTPTNGYPYTGKILHDQGSAPTYKTYWFDDLVEDGPDTATEDKSYATEADVVAYAQTGDYTASTVPTQAQVLGFLEQRSARVYARLALLMGSSATGPSGYSTTIDNSTDPGLALERATRRAAALGAAADALRASGAGDTPQQTSRADDLETLFNAALDDLQEPALQYIGHPTRSATHISAGDSTVPTTTVIDQQGAVFDHTTDF